MEIENEKTPHFLKNDNQNLNQNISRPPIKDYKEHEDDILFMQIDVDCDNITGMYYMPPENNDKPIQRVYGVTESGNSVMAIVTDFYPYFYIECPAEFDLQTQKSDFMGKLNEHLINNSKQGITSQECVIDIEIVEKTSIYNFHNSKAKFIKITVLAPKMVSTLRELFEEGKITLNMTFPNRTYESKCPFSLRYMIDNGIVGMSWITLPKGKYRIRHVNKISTAQLEVEISYRDVLSHAPEGAYAKIAPIRVLSIDIECAAKQGRFPNAELDPVIQISNICVEFGSKDPIVQKLFSFKKCAAIAGADVESFDQEKEMLEKWGDFIVELDPDIITGYNINGFDLPYLLNRAERLKADRLKRISRIKGTITKIKHSKGKSKSFKNRDFVDLNIDGRVILDMYIYVMKEHRLRSFTLNNVSFTFLGEQKEDVHHTMIYDLWDTDEFTRRRLAIYCMKDAYLPLKLAEKLMTLYNYSEMCRVTCTPLKFILTRGQQIKVSSQLHRKALEHNFLIPNIRVKAPDNPDEEGYEGAYVLDPLKGFYDIPIVTLDFASLYPSIMMAHNLCYSTLLRSGEEKSMSPDDYFKSPTGDCFVKEHVRKGILPIILEELISARKKAKEDLKKAESPELKAVLDGRQLALKISANSVYGFTGAQIGQLPCLQISSSTTAVGREMIEKTREIILNRFNVSNGYKHNSVVIYGDTDSVMIKFGETELKEAMKLGKEASEYVSGFFKRPIKIEFEKVYFPYLLMKKKKYAGVIWTKVDKYDKIDTKGLEAVRRDNCELVRDLVESVLKKILIDRNVNDALEYCKGTISDLLQNKIDISLLVISKSLSKNAKQEENENENDEKGHAKKKANDKKNTYQGKQAHVELAEKMRKRDEGTAPNVGDRVAYVIIKGEKGSKMYENSEDPKYVLEKDLPIDTNYYIENQLKKPLLRIFSPISDKAEQILFSGEHMKTIYSGSSKSNPFKNFVFTKKSCLNCKVSINSGPLCKNCKGKLREIYIERKMDVNYYERLFTDLWTQCQRCQGSLTEDVICSNQDCAIFYRRIKVKKDLKEAYEKINRFDEKFDF